MMSTSTSCHRGGGEWHRVVPHISTGHRRGVPHRVVSGCAGAGGGGGGGGGSGGGCCCQDHVNDGAIEVLRATCINSSILNTTINDEDINDDDDDRITNGCCIATNASVLDGGGSGRQRRIVGGCIITSFPDVQAPAPAGAGAVAVCRCCQDHVDDIAIKVSRATCVDLSILDTTIDDDDIYPACETAAGADDNGLNWIRNTLEKLLFS
jgi:hypothetical protein